jgi:alpha-tubulin suppressor-like RCC1 family protein
LGASPTLKEEWRMSGTTLRVTFARGTASWRAFPAAMLMGCLAASVVIASAPARAVTLPPLLDVLQVESGSHHTCALTTQGEVKCWGYGGHGRLGNGAVSLANTLPVDVIGLGTTATAISVGTEHACALTSQGGVKCWGKNGNGRLGDGTTINRATPVQVTGLTSGVVAISAGGIQTCAVTSAGGLKCWGENATAAPGTADTLDRTTPWDVAGSGIASVDTGRTHTCALRTTGAVTCWGYNNQGALGDGTTLDRPGMVNVQGLASGVTSIALGGMHACALTAISAVKCWGLGSSGQLGNGSFGQQTSPVDVTGLQSGVAAIGAGSAFGLNGDRSCALLDSGALQCWGDNQEGQLGDGNSLEVLGQGTPVTILPAGSGITSFSVGGAHTCARLVSGGVTCWGVNNWGQLGDGARSFRSSAAPIAALPAAAVGLAVGRRHACALTDGGAVLCWGANSVGQLGDGSTTMRVQPVLVLAASGAQAVEAGELHTCLVTSAGGVQCWGSNDDGRLGDGTVVARHSPTDVTGLSSGIAAVQASHQHTCALTIGGGVKCWGYNIDGRVGDGTSTTRLAPVDVATLTGGVAAVATGFGHSCALLADGTVKCWGANNNGQIGDGTLINRAIPTPVQESRVRRPSAQARVIRAHWSNSAP